MKNLFLTLFILSISLLSAQDKNKKIEKVGSFFEVTIYYDNGEIMQHGFLSKENKLHASWESYNEDGSRKCIATYNHGEKVGTWFYWEGSKKTQVTYEKNKIIDVKVLDSVPN